MDSNVAEITTSEMSFVAIDFETATFDRASACSVAIVLVESGKVTVRDSWLIRPPANYYSSRNNQIHGITPEMTADANVFSDVWSDAMNTIGDLPLVAHNASFDVGVIRSSCEYWGIAPPDNEYYCSVKLARRAFPEIGAWNLPKVSGYLGIDLDHHDALSDASACADITIRCAEQVQASSLEALANTFFKKPAGRIAG